MRLDLLDLMGPRYLLDHCVDAFRREQEEKQYRAYITDGIKAVTKNTANFAGGDILTMRWYDIFTDALNPQPEDNRTGEEIAIDMLERNGITVIG